MLRSFLLRSLTVAALALGLASPADAVPDDLETGRYVIIHPTSLEPAAREWAAYRRGEGWVVTRITVPEGMSTDEQRRRLRWHLRAVHAEAAGDAVAALLLGDVPTESSPGVPTWYFPQPEPALQIHRTREYATDHPYQLMDDLDERPDIALGRIPVRTNEQARAVLEKIRRHDLDRTPAHWRARVTYVAGEGRFGPLDLVLERLFREMIDRLVPPRYDISMTYAHAGSIYCPPPSQARQAVIDRLCEGSLLFNYIGHGSATGLDALHWHGGRAPLLRASDLDALDERDPRPTIALLTCCSTGWFDLRGRHSLAEAMLLHPNGPIAVIAGSRPTHPYANAVLQKDISEQLLGARVRRVGALDQYATRGMLERDAVDLELDLIAAPISRLMQVRTSLPALRRMHARLYNLLGDPATHIHHPGTHVRFESTSGSALRGQVPGMTEGRIIVTLETRREAVARPNELRRVRGDTDPDLESKARTNYARANERALLRLEADVREGAFEITLPDHLPSRAAVLRAYAFGETDDGEPLEALGARTLHTTGGGWLQRARRLMPGG